GVDRAVGAAEALLVAGESLGRFGRRNSDQPGYSPEVDRTAPKLVVDRAERNGAGALRIAMVAPPWIPVPPPGYGGIECVLDLLCRGLVRRGHSVTLFAAPGSTSVAEVEEVLERPHPERINYSLYEADHVART